MLGEWVACVYCWELPCGRGLEHRGAKGGLFHKQYIFPEKYVAKLADRACARSWRMKWGRSGCDCRQAGLIANM